jgi:uncharacterized MAPEG superfamily protein
MTIDVLAGIFILARIIHRVSYVKDKPRLHSSAWGIGFSIIIALSLFEISRNG